MIQKVRKLRYDKRLEQKRDTIDFLNPKKCYYHLTSTRCNKSELFINEGDYVKVGQPIGLRDGKFFKQHIHSTISGTYVGKEKHMYRSGRAVDFIVIENDFKDEYYEGKTDLTNEQLFNLSKEEMVKLVADNSDVGLGGSGFPTYIKLETNFQIETIVINAVECEPYLNTDYQNLYKHNKEILLGISLLIKYYEAEKAVIAIKHKFSELISVVEQQIKNLKIDNIEVNAVKDYYPQGYEKDVIKTISGKKIPANVMPAEYGYMVFNSTSVLSIYESLRYNTPLITKEISVIGNDFKKSTNVNLRVGTSFRELQEFLGGYTSENLDDLLVLGGPMMGTSVRDDDIIITKSLSTLLLTPKIEVVEEPCINCGSCVNSCPVDLQPILISRALDAKDKKALDALNVKTCIECGLCSYVCTSKIDLTKKMRKAKRMK